MEIWSNAIKETFEEWAKEKSMLDILQSFVDITEANIKNGKYEDLHGDVEAVKWVLQKLKEKDKRIAVLEDINNKLKDINAEIIEDQKCLHCGKDKAFYCERLLSRFN